MTGGAAGWTQRRRTPPVWACLLVALALLVRVAVPGGFMVAPEASSIPLVICTGHGPLQGAASKSDHGKAPARSQDVCPFAAANVAAPGAPALVGVGEPVRIAVVSASPLSASAAAPGRGLAAPPPPSRAPPALLS